MFGFLFSAAVALAAHAHPTPAPNYLPDTQGQQYVTVEKGGKPAQTIVIMTEAVAVNETGPKETVAKFGEMYAFSPNFLAVTAEKPVEISFWNLQPDDEHDVMLIAPDETVLMHWSLPPLSKTPFTYTFHKTGAFSLVCTLHQPEMSAQVLVQP